MYKALLLSSVAVASATDYSSTSHDNMRNLFNNFKKTFQKKYRDDNENEHRFLNFVQQLRLIDQRNRDERKAGGSAVHDITQFADMSEAEFASRYLQARPSMKTSSAPVAEVPPYTGSSDSVDWTGEYTTPVKNQGYCGSCWAFSASEQIESDAMRVLKTSYVLSPEQITQCDTTSYGCNGGWTEHAYKYVKGIGGIETEKDYPYTSGNGVTGKCHADDSKFVIKVNGYTTVHGETNMANYMLSTGPLSVCLDANNWNSYSGGIMKNCGKQVDHCVQAVGVDTGKNGYWKVRNSWGASWGENGYIRLAYGENTCDITSDPTYVSVSMA
jgi:C1A family cysteine protease